LALFVSELQQSDNPTTNMVAEAITRSMQRFGPDGCADTASANSEQRCPRKAGPSAPLAGPHSRRKLRNGYGAASLTGASRT
jgi:hypothetical protein